MKQKETGKNRRKQKGNIKETEHSETA